VGEKQSNIRNVLGASVTRVKKVEPPQAGPIIQVHPKEIHPYVMRELPEAVHDQLRERGARIGRGFGREKPEEFESSELARWPWVIPAAIFNEQGQFFETWKKPEIVGEGNRRETEQIQVQVLK
jgi:hypothetical protein